MTDWRERGQELIEKFNLCVKAKPRHNAVDVQLEKDTCAKFAHHLNTQISWGGDHDIAEACHQLESRLKSLEEKLVMEILTHGTI